MNIAMVDDNQADLDKMKGALEEYGAANGMEIAFHAFLSGEKLLADYRPCLYAAVFPDIFMDGMTGIEVAEKIPPAQLEVPPPSPKEEGEGNSSAIILRRTGCRRTGQFLQCR